MGGWVEVKAVLMIAYSNQKLHHRLKDPNQEHLKRNQLVDNAISSTAVLLCFVHQFFLAINFDKSFRLKCWPPILPYWKILQFASSVLSLVDRPATVAIYMM